MHIEKLKDINNCSTTFQLMYLYGCHIKNTESELYSNGYIQYVDNKHKNELINFINNIELKEEDFKNYKNTKVKIERKLAKTA